VAYDTEPNNRKSRRNRDALQFMTPHLVQRVESALGSVGAFGEVPPGWFVKGHVALHRSHCRSEKLRQTNRGGKSYEE